MLRSARHARLIHGACGTCATTKLFTIVHQFGQIIKVPNSRSPDISNYEMSLFKSRKTDRWPHR